MNAFVLKFPLLALTAAVFLGAGTTQAQTTVSTGTCGYVQLTCTAASDTSISVPFQQPAAYVGTTASVSGSTITLSGTAGWTANQFVYSGSGSSTYYALLGPATSGSNPKEGCWYPIASNGTNSITVSLNGDTIGTVPAGSYVSIIPFWTLATVFPPSTSGTAFIASTAFTIETEVLLPVYSGSGINVAPVNTYYFVNGAWRLFGNPDSSVSFNDTVLLPDGYFVVRNPAGATTTLTAMGNVLTGKLTIPLSTLSTGAQDNYVSMVRPVDVMLNDTGLISSGAFTPSPNGFQIADELLVYSGSTTGINIAPDITYYYLGGWKKFGDQNSNDDYGTATIPAGSGFIIRKAPVAGNVTTYWQNSANY